MPYDSLTKAFMDNDLPSGNTIVKNCQSASI